MTRENAEKIVDTLLVDLQDRRGLGHEWFQIDEAVQVEIRETWIQLVMGVGGDR